MACKVLGPGSAAVLKNVAAWTPPPPKRKRPTGCRETARTARPPKEARKRARRHATGGAFGDPTNARPEAYVAKKRAKAAAERERRSRTRGSSNGQPRRRR